MDALAGTLSYMKNYEDDERLDDDNRSRVTCITTTITTQSTQRDHDTVVSPSVMTVENPAVYSTPIGVD